MARRHRKAGIVKSAVATVMLSVATSERKVVTNPVTGELEVTHIEVPAVVKQGKALAPTTQRGNPNAPHDRTKKGGK